MEHITSSETVSQDDLRIAMLASAIREVFSASVEFKMSEGVTQTALHVLGSSGPQMPQTLPSGAEVCRRY